MTPTITDLVQTLNLIGYPGNDFKIVFRVLGTDPLPVTTLKALWGQGGSELDDALQPTVLTDDRDIIVTFSQTDKLPESGAYEMRFDGRIILSGALRFSVSAAQGKPIDAQHTILFQQGENAGIVLLYPSGLRIPEVETLADLPRNLTEFALFRVKGSLNLYGVKGTKGYVILMDEFDLTDLPQ
jgi:hypothetical protein